MENMLESVQDTILQEDLEAIANGNLPFEKLENKSFLVTGATGLVGSMLVKALACCNRKKNLGMTILPMVRNEEKAKTVFGDLLARKDIELVKADIMQPISLEKKVDYIVHCASVTTSKIFVTQPVETIKTSIDGTTNLLNLAKDCGVESMVYISSMEAFGITDPALKEVKEDDLGYIDVMNVRSCYSEGKRMCELLCASYKHEYEVPVKVARLAQTFGAGVSKDEGRVFAQFAKSALGKKDIVLHTKGESTGNYCYTADAVLGILTVLLKGNDGEVYTIANPNTTIQIKDMAKMVADTIGNGDVKVVFDIPEDQLTYGYAPDVAMHLNADKLKGLGWEPRYDLPDMYKRLVDSFIAQGLEV
ncbi:MAG: NAD-dependent epimerase/dehydratase family protein [Eubacteriales bacterium]|nr:NAD-dependent epimerase/dehydratase family protein [Eubacteriales bacterium]